MRSQTCRRVRKRVVAQQSRGSRRHVTPMTVLLFAFIGGLVKVFHAGQHQLVHMRIAQQCELQTERSRLPLQGLPHGFQEVQEDRFVLFRARASCKAVTAATACSTTIRSRCSMNARCVQCWRRWSYLFLSINRHRTVLRGAGALCEGLKKTHVVFLILNCRRSQAVSHAGVKVVLSKSEIQVVAR